MPQSHAASEIELSGVRIPLHPEVYSENILTALRSGSYERAEARGIQSVIRPRDRVLEIGAGIGYLSTLIAKNPSVDGVRVFEANPLLIPIISEIHQLNGIASPDVCNGVLTNDRVPGDSTFYVRGDFWASSLIRDPWPYDYTIEVQSYNFDEQIAEFRPTLIVCDIEGGELDLFCSAGLTAVERVYMEIHQAVIGRAGVKRLFDSLSLREFHYDQHHSCGGIVLFSRVTN